MHVAILDPLNALLIVVGLFSFPVARAADWDPPEPDPKNPMYYVDLD